MNTDNIVSTLYIVSMNTQMELEKTQPGLQVQAFLSPHDHRIFVVNLCEWGWSAVGPDSPGGPAKIQSRWSVDLHRVFRERSPELLVDWFRREIQRHIKRYLDERKRLAIVFIPFRQNRETDPKRFEFKLPRQAESVKL